MNEAAARLGRQINRIAGTLGKRDEIAKLGPLPHKLPRKVKRWWASIDHRTRGRARKHWEEANWRKLAAANAPIPKKLVRAFLKAEAHRARQGARA